MEWTYLHSTKLPKVHEALDFCFYLVRDWTARVSPEIFPGLCHTEKPHRSTPDKHMRSLHDVSNDARSRVYLIGSIDTTTIRRKRDKIHEKCNCRYTEEHICRPECGRSHPWMDIARDKVVACKVVFYECVGRDPDNNNVEKE